MKERLLLTLCQITEEERHILEDKKIDQSIYTDQDSFTVDAKKMLERGKLIALRPHTRFIDFPSHNHNYIEIMYTCKGSITHVVNGNAVVEVRQGELLFLSCNTCHETRCASAGDIAINLIVLPPFFDTACNMMQGENTLSRFVAENLRGFGEISYLHFRVADILPVQNLMENMIYDITYRIPNRQNINQITMGLLFLQLLNHTERLELAALRSYESQLVITVLREIEERYPEASLAALSRQLNQSVSGLSRLVRQATGKTFKELLQEKRFSKAAQLLTTSRLSVADIAASVGYANTSYFHRKFQERCHMSPAAYRSRHFGK